MDVLKSATRRKPARGAGTDSVIRAERVTGVVVRAAVVAWAMVLLASSVACGAEEQGTRSLEGRGLPHTDLAVDSLWTVGEADGPAEEAFARIDDVRFDAEGRLLVLDGPAARVLVFGPEGNFQTALGREGQGPGEFRLPVSVAPTHGGIAVLDAGNRRISVLGLDGSLRRELAVPEEVGRMDLLSTSAGELVLLGNGDYFAEPDSLPVYVYPPGESRQPRVAFRVRNPRTEPQAGPATRDGNGRIVVKRRAHASFFPDVRIAATAGRIAVVGGNAYRVELRDSEGRISGALERPVLPRPVTNEIEERERTARQARLLDRATGGGGSFAATRMTEAEVENWVAEMAFPDTVPAILGMKAAPDGSVWVLRSGDDPTAPGPVDVFGDDGTFLGSWEDVPFPEALGPDGLVAWIEEGELGVERVRVGRTRFR